MNIGCRGYFCQAYSGDLELFALSRLLFPERFPPLALMYVFGMLSDNIARRRGPQGTMSKFLRDDIPKTRSCSNGNRLFMSPATYVTWVEVPMAPFDGCSYDIINGRHPRAAA